MNYPKIKKVIWRFVRVFVAAFLGSVAINLESIVAFNDIYPLLIVPAIAAGIAAIGKAIREYVADEDYVSRLHKIPV